MNYALTIIINSFIIIFTSLCFGFIFEAFYSTVIALLGFASFRLLTGGYHFQSSLACNFSSILLCSLAPHLAQLIPNYILIFMNFISLFLLILIAPRFDRNTFISKKHYLKLKLIAILFALLTIWTNSTTLEIVVFVQTLSLLLLERSAKHE
ncbi:accessory gene regulator B family protein [Paenibacillus sabuli]